MVIHLDTLDIRLRRWRKQCR